MESEREQEYYTGSDAESLESETMQGNEEPKDAERGKRVGTGQA